MSHPLDELLKRYIDDFKDFKKNNEELDNIAFHRNYGLQIDPPVKWNVPASMKVAAEHAIINGFQNFVVVYSTTEVYNRASTEMNKIQCDGSLYKMRVNYFSWHEFYSAAGRASEDMTYIRYLRNQLMDAEVVFFMGASTALNDVVDQIRASTTGCLILLG